MLIKFKYDPDYDDDGCCYINPFYVGAVTSMARGGAAIFVAGQDLPYEVSESPEKVADRINKEWKARFAAEILELTHKCIDLEEKEHDKSRPET